MWHPDAEHQRTAPVRSGARATSESYVRYAKAFVSHFGRSADELGTEDVRTWVLWLLTVKKLDAATVNVAIASLKFLFATTLTGRRRMGRSCIVALTILVQRETFRE